MIYSDVETIVERFMRRVRKELNGCWTWTGHLGPKGYGEFCVEYTRYGAHKWSYLLFCGEIDTYLQVLHSCDNPSCVNPKHLFLGTDQDNKEDMLMKDRQASGIRNARYTRPESTARGEYAGNVKLTEKDVLEIRFRYKNKLNTPRELAYVFSVCYSTINYILNRITWTPI
jgi:hypothetical protein